MSGHLRALLLAGGLTASLAAGVLGGSALAERASRPGTQVLALVDPALAGAGVATPLRSPGGFTGFDGRPALGGVVVRVGETDAAEPRSLTVVDGTGTVTVNLVAPLRLFRLGPADRPLTAGDVVLLRVDADGVPLAVLRVPPDLGEGEARGGTIRSRQEAEGAAASATPEATPAAP